MIPALLWPRGSKTAFELGEDSHLAPSPQYLPYKTVRGVGYFLLLIRRTVLKLPISFLVHFEETVLIFRRNYSPKVGFPGHIRG